MSPEKSMHNVRTILFCRLAAWLLLPALAFTGCFQLRAVQEENSRLELLIDELQLQNEKCKTEYYALLERQRRLEADAEKETRRLEREIEKQKTLRGEREKALEQRNQELALQVQQQREDQARGEKAFNARLEELRRTLAAKDESLKTNEEKITALLERVKAKEDEATEANKKIAELDVQVKQLTAQKSEMQQKFESEKSGADERKQEVAELKVENAALRETIADKQEDIAAKDQKINELNAEKKQLEAALNQRRALEDEIQRRLKLLQENGGAGDPRELEKQKQEIEELKKQLEALKDAEALSPAERDPELNKVQSLLHESFQAERNKGIFEILRDARGVVVRVPGDQIFESGTVVLNAAIQPTLKILAAALAQFPHHTIEVQGHTDNQPVVNLPFPDNLALSAQRAVNVARFLSQNGLPAEAVRASAFGATKPIGDNAKPSGRKLNRRVEIVIEPLVK